MEGNASNPAPAGVCPRCGAAALRPDPSGTLACRQCGATFAEIRRSCPACGAPVDPSDETCPACGGPLGIAAQVLAQRAGRGSALWLDRVRSEAPSLQASGEQSSRGRMEAFSGMDRRREEAWAAQAAARAGEDRRLLGIMGIALLVFLAVVAAALLASSLR